MHSELVVKVLITVTFTAASPRRYSPNQPAANQPRTALLIYISIWSRHVCKIVEYNRLQSERLIYEY